MREREGSEQALVARSGFFRDSSRGVGGGGAEAIWFAFNSVSCVFFLLCNRQVALFLLSGGIRYLVYLYYNIINLGK